MASWSEFEQDAPELAAQAKGHLDAHLFKLLATTRMDGSPRISGVEIQFTDGELYTGSMSPAVKAMDLQRDPRFALHSCPPASDDWTGDAKLAGTMAEITDDELKHRVVGGNAPPGPMHLFRADITEVVVVHLNAERTKLLVDAWHPGRGVERTER